MLTSPYVQHPLRLQDVMAAIQVMATYRHDTSTIPAWTERLGQPVSLMHGTWEQVFREHPEFFRVDDWTDPSDGKHQPLASLKWRKANERVYDTDRRVEVTAVEARERDRASLGRTPLTADQVGTLLKAAVDLDARASASQERKDRALSTMLTVVFTLLTAVVGVILGALLKVT